MRVPDTNGVVRGPAAGKQEGEGGGGAFQRVQVGVNRGA